MEHHNPKHPLSTPHSKKAIFLGVGLVLLLSAALLIYGISQRNARQARLESLAALDAQQLLAPPTPGGELLVVAAHFTIYESEVQEVARRNQILTQSKEDLAPEALRYLIELKSVFHTALLTGYELTDEELQSAAAQDWETMKHSEDYSSFLDYVKAMALTPEDYWALVSKSPNYRQELVIDRYFRDQRDTLFSRNALPPDSPEAEELWARHHILLGQMAMESEGVELVSAQEKYQSIDLHPLPDTPLPSKDHPPEAVGPPEDPPPESAGDSSGGPVG